MLSEDAEGLVAAFRTFPPLILTEGELRAVLLPLVVGDEWALDTVGDLWRMGAPVPGDVGAGVRRVILPGQLGRWLGDVLGRRGVPLSEAARAWVDLQSMERRR